MTHSYPTRRTSDLPSSSGDCVSVAPTANRRREAPTHAGPHGAGIAGRVACARCHSAAPAHHGVTELRYHRSSTATQRGRNSGDLSEEEAREDVEGEHANACVANVLKLTVDRKSTRLNSSH